MENFYIRERKFKIKKKISFIIFLIKHFFNAVSTVYKHTDFRMCFIFFRMLFVKGHNACAVWFVLYLKKSAQKFFLRRFSQ
jgi:hypothetical protein